MKTSRRIFISYRRADTRGYAHAIYNLLVPDYGEEAVFMDVDTIRPGEDFERVLNSAVKTCDVLLALIGPRWLAIPDEGGQRRLDNPRDFVRLEIESALRNDILVIPILLEDARMPGAADLPGELKALANRQAFVVGNHLASDIARLRHVIQGTSQASSMPASAGIPSPRLKKERARPFPWVGWLFLSLVAIPGTFYAFMHVANFIWYYTRGWMSSSGGYQFIALQSILESSTLFVYLFFSQGCVSLIQWFSILHRHLPSAGFWLISNSVFGLAAGFGLDTLIRLNLLGWDNMMNAIFGVFAAWCLYNVVLGPWILLRRKTPPRQERFDEWDLYKG